MTENSGWTGSCLDFARADYARVRGREELGRTGVYILVGPEEGEGPGARIYVGETDLVRTRLAQHQNSKDFWTRAYVLTSRTEALNKAHVRYLEARLIELARQSGAAALDNDTEPPVRGLNEADVADMETYLDETLLLLPLVGVDSFTLVEAPAATSSSDGSAPSTQQPASHGSANSSTGSPSNAPVRYFLREKLVQAEALDDARGFTVLEGSLGRAETKTMLPGYKRLRDRLLADGVLVPEGDQQLRLTRAYAFPSPSAAAAALIGGSRNGRFVWKDANGRSLGDRQSDTTR